MTIPTEREVLIARLRVGYTLHQNDTPDLDAADELMGLAADMLEADAQPSEMQQFIDGLPDDEDKMFLQIEEWQRTSYNHSRSQIKGQQVTRSDSPDSHLVWATLRWAKENVTQQVAVPQSSLSWSGFNLSGSAESITEANRLLHEAGTVPELKQRIKDNAQQMAVPQRLKLTPEMITAFKAAFKDGSIWTDRMTAALEAMLAAAPQPPQPEARKPLTEEEVRIALGLERLPGPSVMVDVRKIEAALGIGAR